MSEINPERKYVCSYSRCLHNGFKVLGADAVVIGNKRYHPDCAELKMKIDECAEIYMEYVEDKTQYPVVMKILQTLIFKNRVPADFILLNLRRGREYYHDKPVYALYGLRSLFWNKEMKEK